MINRLCIIGVGLIGGSLALSLKKAGYCQSVIGAGRNVDNLKKAVELNVIDEYETDLTKAVAGADVIVLAVPLGAMTGVFEKIAPVIKESAIITDVGSAKCSVIEAAKNKLGDQVGQFVPGHPIAGTEQSGVEAAFDSLYQDRRVILTPLTENSAQSIQLINDMWLATDARLDQMDAAHHDLILAGTSHLPHMLAFSLVDCLNKVDDVDEIFKYAAGGFRDFTRIASSDPVMWRDICLSNDEALLSMIQRYQTELGELKAVIENKDSAKLLEMFSRAKKARDDFSM
jgi:prephenate dehydrogenase